MAKQAAMLFPRRSRTGCMVLCVALLPSCSSDASEPSSTPGGAGSGGAANAGGSSLSGAGGGLATSGGLGGTGVAVGGSGGSTQAGGGGSGGSGGAAAPVCESPPLSGLASSRHTARPLGSTQAENGFYEYLPPGYGDDCPRPLLVFYPGSGELGNGVGELDRLLIHGPPKLIDQDVWPNERPFIVLSVQHPEDCTNADNVEAFLSYALDNYAVDPNRIYLTGLSCGGYRSWDYIGKYAGQQVAAIVPVAGDGRLPWASAGCELGQVAIWAFHGDADMAVDPPGSAEPVANLLNCPAPPRKDVKLTTYPGVGHDSWTATYDLSAGHDIYTWLLKQSR